ncbi:MAG: glutamate synthase subunit alpha, partial [Actinomycetota bacterium]
VVNFFEFIAEEVREHLAALGFRSLQEAIGHVEMIDARGAVDHWKAHGLDISPILETPRNPYGQTLHSSVGQDHGLDEALDNDLIAAAQPALLEGTPVSITRTIRNVNRTVGTMLGHEVTRSWGGEGLPDGTISIRFTGSAGQSFGAFVPRGVELRLEGDANDYLAKGLSGGRVILHPPDGAGYVAEENVIAGNVIGYGATSGEIFIRGMVGERFCVRNSGVTAVVEGVGDHGCEYMTGGRVVVLGPTGRNFAAGMSGGIAYVWDPDGVFPGNVNYEMVDLEHVGGADEEWLRAAVERHRELTGSEVAARILAAWTVEVPRFRKVMPRDYRSVLEVFAEAEKNGWTEEQTAERVMEVARG